MKKQIHVVAAVIKNNQDEIFCAKRSPHMSLPNYWEFPGGKIEQGETKESALIREIIEELQCQIAVDKQIDNTFYEYDHFIIRLETFWCTLIEGRPVLQEHADSKWLTYDKLNHLDWAPADIPAVRKVVDICKREFMNK